MIFDFITTWTCNICGSSWRDTANNIRKAGCAICNAPYDELTHIPVIVCDTRETRSGVPAECEQNGAEVHVYELEVADFVVSDRVGFERKTAPDMLQDWLDNRELFSKLHDLKRAYSHPILLLEGYTEELFTLRRIDPAKVQAMIFTIARMGIPMIETINPKGTARTLIWFAKKEQSEEKRLIQLHGKRSHLSPKQMKEYVISSFPDCNVGTATAIALLNHFKTIESVVTASAEELQAVPGIGESTAERIRKLLTEEYK